MKKIILLFSATLLLMSCGQYGESSSKAKGPASYEIYCDNMFAETELLKQMEVEAYEYDEAGDVINKTNITFESDNTGETFQAQPTAVKVKVHVKLALHSTSAMVAMFSMTANDAANYIAKHPYDYYGGWYPVTVVLTPGETSKINLSASPAWSNEQP